MTEGDFTLKEVKGFSELDDDARMHYSVGRMFERLYERAPSTRDDVENRYQEWVKEIEESLERELKGDHHTSRS